MYVQFITKVSFPGQTIVNGCNKIVLNAPLQNILSYLKKQEQAFQDKIDKFISFMFENKMS